MFSSPMFEAMMMLVTGYFILKYNTKQMYVCQQQIIIIFFMEEAAIAYWHLLKQQGVIAIHQRRVDSGRHVWHCHNLVWSVECDGSLAFLSQLQ